MLQATTTNIFQERLNHLFACTRATYRDVVDGTGGAIREAYFWQLRTGHAINPSFKVISALASTSTSSRVSFSGRKTAAANQAVILRSKDKNPYSLYYHSSP
jgi:hypothetical protein